jgi:two-component system, OmpR family, KDP operon response regulator KdpE
MTAPTPAALIVDDEVQIRRLLRAALEGSGWRVIEADSGQLGISEVAVSRPDAVILDLGLPDMDGVEVVRRLREWSRVPILIASVRDDAAEKIRALDAGADDYVSKPFNTAELLARLRAIQRRGDAAGDKVEFAAGGLRVDFAGRTVTVDGREVHFTPTEYALLKILAINAGKVVTGQRLLRDVWGPRGPEHGNYLRVHMTHLRRKLSASGFDRRRLRTEPGVGYRLLE